MQKLQPSIYNFVSYRDKNLKYKNTQEYILLQKMILKKFKGGFLLK